MDKDFLEDVKDSFGGITSKKPEFQKGDIVQVKEGWLGHGNKAIIVGDPIYVRQWWVPVICEEYGRTGDEPDFYKAAALTKIGTVFD